MRGVDSGNWLEALEAKEAIGTALATFEGLRICLTCSFQAEGVVLLDLLRKRVSRIPVLFLDTGYHFAETYEFRDRLAKEWSLNVVNLYPRQTVSEQESQFGILHRTDPARCCQMRKVEPLLAALEDFDVWFTGLRREQSVTRRNVKKAEKHVLSSGKELWKINPLADWTASKVWTYLDANAIPWLPPYDEGYTSIGCEPCTAMPSDLEDPRSGRWGGARLECGLHTFSIRTG
jgi:phosphoadenosine phosphosulfate reductase